MRARFFCFLVLFLQVILSLGRVSSRRFAPPNYSLIVNNQGKTQNSHTSNEGILGSVGKAGKYKKEIEEIGSRPPKCEHKCYGCMPCEAIQVPTTTTSTHVVVQYANYEPEGWKCKCGHTFYTP